MITRLKQSLAGASTDITLGRELKVICTNFLHCMLASPTLDPPGISVLHADSVTYGIT